MYEIIIDGSMNSNKKIENEKLRNATAIIAYAMNAGKQAVMCVAYTLNEVAQSETYLLGGFKSMNQYASTMFNMSDTTCRKYVRIGGMITKKSLTDENGNTKEIFKSIFAKGEKDFSVGHLLEIEAKIKDYEIIKELIENGVISFDMSTKKVREICTAFKDGDIDTKGNRLIEISLSDDEPLDNNTTANKSAEKNSTAANKVTDTVKEITVTPKDNINPEDITPIEIVQLLRRYCKMYHALELKDKTIDKAVENLLKAINK